MAAIRPKYRADGTINGYHAPVRIAGHPPQTATFERKTDAKRWSAETEAAIRQGRYFKTSRANQHTVAEAIDRFAVTWKVTFVNGVRLSANTRFPS